MPIVSIPEKEMTVRFPDDMPTDEIERNIYTHVYGQAVLSQAEPPTLTEKLALLATDLFEGPDPGLGPLTKADIQAFDPGEQFDESGFQRWYGAIAKQQGLDPDPDDPRQRYDYRAAYVAGAGNIRSEEHTSELQSR